MLEQFLLYLVSIPTFLAYFVIGGILLLMYVLIYNMFTPMDEWQLIKQNNVAASIGLAGSLLGFIIPLAAAIHNAASAMGCIFWGLVALTVQVAAFFAVKLFMPALAERIRNGEAAAGVLLAAISLSVGILNAASMTY